jgi:hypothetical protein
MSVEDIAEEKFGARVDDDGGHVESVESVDR